MIPAIWGNGQIEYEVLQAQEEGNKSPLNLEVKWVTWAEANNPARLPWESLSKKLDYGVKQTWILTPAPSLTSSQPQSLINKMKTMMSAL